MDYYRPPLSEEMKTIIWEYERGNVQEVLELKFGTLADCNRYADRNNLKVTVLERGEDLGEL